MDKDDTNDLTQALKELPRRELARYPGEPHLVYVCISTPPGVAALGAERQGPFSIPDCAALVAAGAVDLNRTKFECDTLPGWFPLDTLLQCCEGEEDDAA